VPRTDDVLVPPRRLGTLLRQSRVAAGEDLADVASRARSLTARDLDAFEHGRRMLDDVVLRELIDAYGVEEAELLPQRSRLVVDLDEGLISVDATRVEVNDDRAPDNVLVRYLALIHRLRGVPVGTPVKIRELDIGILASALRLDESEVERRLHDLMREDDDRVEVSERRLRRRVLVPLAGVVVATTAIGVLVLVGDEDGEIGTTNPGEVMMRITDASSSTQPAALQVETDIGDAVVVEAPGTEIADAAIIEAGDDQSSRD